MGLKLGLDLRGGAHLVYQADTGTRFDVTFLDPIFTQQVENALGELRFGEQQLAFENFAVDSLGASRIRIKTGLLNGNDPRRTEFQETMVEELGSIEAVTITDTDAPTIEEMEGALDTINRRVNLFGTEEPIIQLRHAVEAVFSSWNTRRAVDYRNFNGIPRDPGTAVNVQAMVFGNMDDESSTGVLFTRDPATGNRALYGEYPVNAQGEDLVAGIATPRNIETMAIENPGMHRQLVETCEALERHYRDA